MTDRDLRYEVEEAADQLNRYAGKPFCAEIVDVLHTLTNINDDLYRDKAEHLIVENIAKAEKQVAALRVFLRLKKQELENLLGRPK